MALSEKVLQILACPGCHGALSEVVHYLLCPSCSLKFPVQDGIPVLLLSEAEKTSYD
jgi:uncharacterized protein YbaR (Trm112 family)